MNIYKLIPILIIFFLIQWSVKAQKTTDYKIENLQIHTIQSDLQLNFDLIGVNTNQAAKITLLFYDQDFRIYYPKTLTPDLTQKIMPGNNISLFWHVAADMKKIDKPLMPILIVGDPKQHKFGSGSEAALLSVVVPGLGDYLVNDTRNQTIKPYVKMISAFGLIALGSYANSKRYQGEPEYTDTGDIWKTGEWNYKYFRNDAELIIGAGVAIWAADIIWVAIKGNRNKTLKKSISNLNIQFK